MLRALNDDVVTLRPFQPGDGAALIAGLDEESRRWLGPGDDEPQPTACIVVQGTVVGWVDYDADRDWLEPAEVNVGYAIFPEHRGKGYATRALLLLLQHLAGNTEVRTATLMIDRANARSIAVADRAGFKEFGVRGTDRYFKKDVAP